MNPRERLRTALRGGVPDRVPCDLRLIRWIRYHYGCTCPRHQLKAAQDFGLDSLIHYGHYPWQSVSNDYVYSPGGGYSYSANGLYGDLQDVNVELKVENGPDHVLTYRTFHTPAGALRDVIQWPRPNRGYGDGPNPHRVEPLVKTMRDLEPLAHLFPAPRMDVVADIPLLLEETGERALLVAVDATHAGGWGMETLGPEGMLLASVEQPDLLKSVCRLAQDAHLRNLRAMLEQGIEVVFDSWFQCGPSVGWSPESYRDFFLPLVKEAVCLTHDHGATYVYQDDGRMRDIIPCVVEAGADVLGGLQPPAVGDVILKDVKREFGGRVALLGGLDPCYSFDMGTPESVRSAVQRAIADAGPGGAYVLAPAEAVSPETPAESLLAAGQAARDFGVYGRDLC